MQHLLRAITGEMTRREIQKRLGLKHREHFYDVYLTPALAAGLIERTAPDKPTSRLQRYRLVRLIRVVEIDEDVGVSRKTLSLMELVSRPPAASASALRLAGEIEQGLHRLLPALLAACERFDVAPDEGIQRSALLGRFKPLDELLFGVGMSLEMDRLFQPP